MKTMKSVLLLFLALIVLSAGLTAGTASGGTIRGKVIDKNEKFALPTVRVVVQGTKKFGITNMDGVFVIGNVPAGVYKVAFELSGYLADTVKEVTVTDGQTVEVNVSMAMGFSHEMTVTARREVESLQKVSQNVEVLTNTELKETPVVNIVQALNQVTGVDVETGSGNTTLGTFMSIDGYDDVYIRKMVDGVDIGEVVGNWSMLNAYPQEMIEQVEVIKGGASSVWGSNMGGIVNVITKRPKDLTRPWISLRSTYSSHGKMNFGSANANPSSGDLLRLSANILGNYKKLGYMIGYNRDNSDGFVEFGREKSYNLFAKLGYDFSDRTSLDVLYNYNNMGYRNHAFLTFDALPPDFPYYWNYKMDAGANSQVASVKFNTALSPSFDVETQLKFNRMDYSGTTEYLDGSLFQPPAGTTQLQKFIDQKMGFTLKGAYRPGESFSLVSGVDYYRIKADFTNYIANQPIIYVDTVAPFVSAEYRVGGLGLSAGARYDYDSSFGSQLSPSFGANFNFLSASLVRVNIARTFRVPPLWYTLGESYFDQILPNPNLKPERAWAYSVGFETQELRYLWFKTSLYYHRMTDGIGQVPADIEGRFTWGNISKFIRKGYEVEVGFMAPFGLTGYVGTNYNHHEDISGQETRVLTWIPTRTYKTGLKYKNDKLDLMVNFRGRYIWWNEDQGLIDLFHPQDKKWIFDFRISKGIDIGGATRAEIFLDMFNLTNQLYWDRSDMPNPRRWAALGVEVSFK
jgi:vitamin B12 transporter